MATFASRPAENADPWYATREAYDASLEDAIEANEAAIVGKADDGDLTSHTSNTSNPHSVTAAQVSAVPTATLAASGKGYVNHGATAGTTRPTGYASVEWVGSVEPTNMADGDTWVVTS